LSGPLEPTNQWYAIAKISGLKLIDSLRKQFGKDFISLMPTNLYGPRDNFDPVSSHVLPAMIRKFYDAKINNKKNVILWGSGTPKREFLYVNDLAKVIVFCLENNLSDSIYNVGSSHEISIKDLAQTIKGVVKFKGNIVWDNSKPDGTPRKLLDSSRLNKLFPNNYLDLKTGIQKTYDWFIENNKL
jgi:GDP-L-fucose synthase